MKKLRALVWPVFMAGLALLATGCDTMTSGSWPFTAVLWDNAQAEHYQPAPRPDVKIYQPHAIEDVLVMYLEQREKTGAVKRRAYYLLANEDRVQGLKRPRFVALKTANGLMTIPVERSGSINVCAPVWAELTPDANGFRLFRNGIATDWYHFPVYRDRRNDAERILLTPVAVTADAAVVAAAAGVIGGVIYFEAKCGNCN